MSEKEIKMMLTVDDKEIHLTFNEASALCGKGLDGAILISDNRAQKNIHDDCLTAALEMVEKGTLRLIVV